MRWGVWFEPVRPVAELVELARLAEAEGASTCFVADEGTDRDVWVALTAIALGTERLVVAPAITNPFSRHPVTSAAAAATLAELAPGRVWHGLGVGGSRVLAPLGLDPAAPYTALREAVDTSRQLLAGHPHGSARLAWVDPSHPVPMAVAGRGPRVQALAAERADWVILSAEPLARLPATATRLRAHGAPAGLVGLPGLRRRPSDARCSATSRTWRSTPRPRSAPRPASTTIASTPSVQAMLAGRLDDAAALLPESLVDHYAVAGDPQECAARIAAMSAHCDLFAVPMNDVADCGRAHPPERGDPPPGQRVVMALSGIAA